MQNQEKITQAIAAYLEKNCNGYGEFIHFKDYPECWDEHVAREIAAAIAPHLEAGVNTTKIREAFARYVDTEGCSCCRDSEGHEVAEKELAELLKPLPYVDSSGWDWDKPA